MRKSFIVHIDSLSILDDLDDEQCGQLFRAIKAYQTGESIELSPIVKIAFSPFKNQFARDQEKYQNVIDRNRKNGKKGGRPKNPEKPTGLSGNPSKPKKADSGSKSDSDSDSDSDSEDILIPDGINASAWNEWLSYRKKKKKPVSDAAEKKQFKLLAKYSHAEQQMIIDNSIQNDYQGLFELKEKSNGNQNQYQRNPAGNIDPRSKTVVGRAQIAAEERERRRQAEARACDGSPLEPIAGDLRPSATQSIWGDDAGELGTIIEGCFSAADS